MKTLLIDTLWLARRVARRLRCAALAWLHDAPGLQVGPGSVLRGGTALRIGHRFYANGPVWIEAIHRYRDQTFQPRLVIGNRVCASNGLHISCIDHIEIGDDVLFGSGVLVADHQHGQYRHDPAATLAQPPAERPLCSKGPVHIGARVWIGDHVVIMDRVRIGEGSIIGANAVVTHDIPAGCIAAGAPARVIKQYNPELQTWEPRA